ncbi:MAG: hypothetical protein V1843_01685 [bacterium]
MEKVILIISMFLLASSVCVIAAEQSRELVKIGEPLLVSKGQVYESVLAVGSSATIEGTVKYDVVAVGGSVDLKPYSVVKGNVVSVGGEIRRHAKAKVLGNINEMNMPGLLPFITFAVQNIKIDSYWHYAIYSLMGFLAFLGLGVLAVVLFPKASSNLSGYVLKSPFKSFLWGILGLILIVPIILLLAISILGIFLIPVWGILVFAAFAFGYFAVAMLVGRRVFDSLNKDAGQIWQVIVGLCLLSLIGFVPIIGAVVKMICGIMGAGAVIATRFGAESHS